MVKLSVFSVGILFGGLIGILIGYLLKKEDFAKPNQDAMNTVAEENFKKWLASLATKDPATVAKLYHAEVSFHPTQLGKLQKGQSGAEEYFKHFLQKNPAGKLVEDHVQILTTWLYLHSGLYDFAVKVDGENIVVEARFTFLWILKNGEWKILHHHSSEKPV